MIDSQRTLGLISSQYARHITSLQGVKDPICQLLRRLKTSGGRQREGLFIAEGSDLCGRAVRYGATVETLIMTEGFSQSESSFDLIASMPTTAQIYRCSEGLLAKCLEAKPTPECVAIVRKNYRDWQPLVSGGATPLWVGIDQGENADNLGMLLRSAEAAGVDGVLLAGGTVDAWGRRVVRAARGAMFSLRMSTHNSTLEAVEIAQSAGVQVISTSAKATETYTEVDYCLPTMILVGNEHHGIEEAVVERSDRCVYIPMLGHIHSLNIAVAASLMLYEAQRQRGWISPKSTLQKSVSPP